MRGGSRCYVARVSDPLHLRIVSRLRREASTARPRVRAAASAARTRTAPGGVALTFDDGPMPGSTDRALDVLAELRVLATFFCVGRNAERHAQLLRRIVAEGHALGSHSLTHPHPRDLTPGEVRREYADGHAAVEHSLGARVLLFRPPHGHLSLRTSRLLRAHRPWLWTVDPEDWRPGAQREQVATVAGSAGSGDVVLLHDWVEQPEGPAALDRSATISALPAIVADVRARGLQLVRLTS